jgi:hypothetical protein
MPAFNPYSRTISPRRLLVMPTDTELSITTVAPGRTFSQIVCNADLIILVSVSVVPGISGVGTATKKCVAPCSSLATLVK